MPSCARYCAWLFTHQHLLDWTTAAQARRRQPPGPRELCGAHARRHGIAGRRQRLVVLLFCARQFLARGARGCCCGSAPRCSRARSACRMSPTRHDHAERDGRHGSCVWSRGGPGATSSTFVTAEDHFLPPDNFPGDAGPGACAAHLADQHRHVPAVRGQRAGFRLARPARLAGSPRGDARFARLTASAFAAISSTGTTRARPAAAAELRVHRRQRQSGRSPDGARQCARVGRDATVVGRTSASRGIEDALALAPEAAGAALRALAAAPPRLPSEAELPGDAA